MDAAATETVEWWRRVLWFAVGVGSVVAAVWFSQLLTTDVPVTVDEDGYEYSEGGMFGNVFEAIGWFFLGIVLFLGTAIGFAIRCRDRGLDYQAPGRVSLVLLGVFVVVVLVLAGLDISL